MKLSLLPLVLCLLPAQLAATPPRKATATEEERVYFAKGAEDMRKVVAVCSKKKFDGNALERIIDNNNHISELNEKLQLSPLSPPHQKAFKNYQCYLGGMRSVIDRYISRGYKTQDAVITANKKFLDFALKAPDYQTIVAYNKKQLEAFNERIQRARWEILAELP